MERVWESEKACMQTYLLLAEKDPSVPGGSVRTGRIGRARVVPLIEADARRGESLTAVLNGRDSFAADRAAERYLGRFDHNQFAVEHLEGSVELTGLKKSAPGQWAPGGLLGRRTADRAKGMRNGKS